LNHPSSMRRSSSSFRRSGGRSMNHQTVTD